jgi:hypothetical protein
VDHVERGFFPSSCQRTTLVAQIVSPVSLPLSEEARDTTMGAMSAGLAARPGATIDAHWFS